MKKTLKVMALLLCTITISMVLSSCSKEDSYQRKIVGKWEVVHDYSGRQSFDPANFDQSLYDDYYVGEIWEFFSDGSITIDGAGSITYTIQEDHLVLHEFFVANYHIYELTNSSMIIWMDKQFLDTPVYIEFKKVK